MGDLLNALVGIFKIDAEANVTRRTVKEILSTINSANSALIAVKLFLVLIVKESADRTIVFAKLNPTRCTIAIYRLTCIAHKTDDFADSVSVDLVLFVIVMTDPTWIDLTAARRHICTSALIVATPILFLLRCCPF